jgi:hypothetical protein
MEVAETKSEAKLELVTITGDLMPAGKPAFLDVVKYPMIKDLVVEHGRKTMLKVIFLLVKDFCSSLNLIRNMNEDQMIEAASMLIDECDNFRLEDYTIMFSMGKRGELARIFDHVDIQVITQMLDEYWRRRHKAGLLAQEDELLINLGPSLRMIDSVNQQDAQLMKSANNLTGIIGDLKSNFKKWKDDE